MSVSEPMDTNQQLNAENVMESLGEPTEAAENLGDPTTNEGTSNNTTQEGDPLYVQKRLKQQSRQHQREMRDMQSQMAAMQAHLQGQSQFQHQPMTQSVGANSGDDVIQRAVNAALQQRELNEREQKRQEQVAHVQRKQQEFAQYLDEAGDKYDDFHEKVFNDHTPITSTMRDYAMTLPRKGAGSSAEVIYHLAKNPEELSRISKLQPIDQATEMAKLSHALISGGENKVAQQTMKAPIGNIKNMPHASAVAVTDKTPVSSLRAQMKAGTWGKSR